MNLWNISIKECFTGVTDRNGSKRLKTVKSSASLTTLNVKNDSVGQAR